MGWLVPQEGRVGHAQHALIVYVLGTIGSQDSGAGTGAGFPAASTRTEAAPHSQKSTCERITTEAP